MDRPVTKVLLPVSGMEAEIVTYWTFDEYLQIEECISSAAKSIEMGSNGVQKTEVDATATIKAERLAIRLAIKKLTSPDGSGVNITPDVIGNLDFRDGKVLRATVNAISADQKKG